MSIPTLKQHLLDTYEQEHRKTLRVLHAHPPDKTELRPHAKSKTARELAWMFVQEQGAVQKALTTGFDWSKPPAFSPVPPSFNDVLAAFEEGHARTTALLKDLTDEDLARPVQFFTGPGKIGDIPMHDFLWQMLHDQIHHRGQFTIYLRLADARVPSVYGPTADEPWQ
jgi:uncharacterized damage-inducible protein DinB